VDSPKEFTDRKEEKEDGDVEEDRYTVGHSSHLELGQAFEEIRSNTATPSGRGMDLGILQVLSCPLLDEGGHEGARQAKE
jgi:hypothetical protein